MTSAPYTPSPPSLWVDLDGPVHYVDHGGPAGAPLLVCVHGLGGSHANWAALAPLLTDRYRVLALDLAGFGLTAGGPRSATVAGNILLLQRFLAKVSTGPVVLIGNSMGALICARLAYEHPELVDALVLISLALPPALTVPDRLTLAAFAEFGLPAPLRRARARRRPPLSQEQAMEQLLQLCCGDASRIPREVIDLHVALAQRHVSVPNAEADFLLATRSLIWIMARRRRYAAMLHGLRTPVMLMHGDRDRLIPLRSARTAAAANPYWRFEIAKGAGHIPMLEVPQWTADHLHDWLPAALATARLGWPDEGDPLDG